MAIAGVLMVGLSTFFASTFHNMFQAQAENTATERQYAINQILADKMGTVETLVDFDPAHVLTFNRNTKGQLPFTFISGVDSDLDGSTKKYVGFKDMFPFNKIIYDHANNRYIYGDSGAGVLKNALDGNPIQAIGANNFAGFDLDSGGTTYYVAVPDENTVKCVPACSPALDFSSIGGLRSPMDVEVGLDKNDKESLFISDAGNGRIVQYILSGPSRGVVSPSLATGLSFPTGLAYYQKDLTHRFLFVADTFKHQIRRINLMASETIPIVVGEGDNSDCDNTAKYCKLNLPTGLSVPQDPSGDYLNTLFIADSGSNRILKMTDPTPPSNLALEFGLSQNYALDRIELVGGGWTGGNNFSSNLVSNNTHYTPATKTVENPDRLTVYSALSCTSGSNYFYINEDVSGMNLESGDMLKIGTTSTCALSSVSGTGTDCDPSAEITLLKTKITTTGNCADTTDGKVVYFSNPMDPTKTTLQINGVNWGTSQGFLTTDIKTYDIFNGLVETDHQSTRVGDTTLGTPEDTIQVVAFNDGLNITLIDDGMPSVTRTINNESIQFPTGVSNAYFSNTANPDYKKVINRLNATAGSDLSPMFTTLSPEDYDYISDFPLESVAFSKLNSESILELAITTVADSAGNKQTYKHDAYLP